MSLNYVLTSNSLCIFHETKTVEINKDHLNFKKIVAALNSSSVRFEEIENLACVAKSVSSSSGGKIEVTDLGVFFNGELIHNSVVDAIYEYRTAGLDIKPIVKFLENLMENPSASSIEQLWRFIETHKLPLTEDGHLLAYKCVRKDYKDKFSGTISNTIGSVIKMDRNKISDDARHHCAQGLHVGGLAYSGPNGWYSGHGDKCIIVKVNPKNVVCVPYDHNSTKIRVCEYEVVKDYCDILKNTSYDECYNECTCDEDIDNDYDSISEVSSFRRGDMALYQDSYVEVLSDTEGYDTVVVRHVWSQELEMVLVEDLEEYEE
jgi:hypothetical protein